MVCVCTEETMLNSVGIAGVSEMLPGLYAVTIERSFRIGEKQVDKTNLKVLSFQ